MAIGRKLERRKARSRAFRLSQPYFMKVHKGLAASTLTACAVLATLVSHAAPTVAFGPFFLLICACGAWFVGNRFAVLLGLFIVAVQVLNNQAIMLNGRMIVSTLQFACALAVVLMLGVARAALEIEWQFARVDPLTGALNRKAFFEIVRNDAGRSGLTVLVYADVDGLKRLNDRLGHEAGDEALRKFAERVRKAVRKDDVFARIGGDEFVIFLRVRDVAAAELVAQRLNQELNGQPPDDQTLACSLGVLVLPTGLGSIDAALKQADSLMYHAKRNKAGLTMAISTEGNVRALMPEAAAGTASGPQRAAVRSRQRLPDAATAESAASGRQPCTDGVAPGSQAMAPIAPGLAGPLRVANADRSPPLVVERRKLDGFSIRLLRH